MERSVEETMRTLKAELVEVNIRKSHLEQAIASLRGSLIPTIERRVRQGKIFTKAGPATYGLAEFENGQND